MIKQNKIKMKLKSSSWPMYMEEIICIIHTQEREALMSIINENCKNFSLLNIDAKLVWLLNNANIDILCALCTFLKHI
jgi:hypothetical protein